MRIATNAVYENILQQLMETDEYEKLRVWTSDVEKRDVYLTARKTSPAWKRVIMRKTVDVDTNRVIQVKYIGDENWGNVKEKIENGPKKVRTFMVYLNVESDMDTKMGTTSLIRLPAVLAGTRLLTAMSVCMLMT